MDLISEFTSSSCHKCQHVIIRLVSNSSSHHSIQPENQSTFIDNFLHFDVDLEPCFICYDYLVLASKQSFSNLPDLEAFVLNTNNMLMIFISMWKFSDILRYARLFILLNGLRHMPFLSMHVNGLIPVYQRYSYFEFSNLQQKPDPYMYS